MDQEIKIKNIMKRRIYLTLSFFVISVLIGCTSSTSDSELNVDIENRGYSNPSRLVSAHWLETNLEEDNIVIIDVRKAEDYAAGHIPGAVNLLAKTTFQADNENGVKGMLPSGDHIAALLSSVGVKPTDTIIIYDGIKNLWSSRGLWGLDVYGHKDSRLLDGSWAYWSTNGYEVSTTTPSIKASGYKFSGQPNRNLIADWEEVLNSVDDPSKIVCDTRGPDEYSGKDIRAAQGGHIPGSKNVNWVVNSSGESQEFLPASELKSIYEGAGIKGDQVVFTLCQTAVRATHTWFVLQELLGYPTVKVYDGSWTEWGNAELPIVTR